MRFDFIMNNMQSSNNLWIIVLRDFDILDFGAELEIDAAILKMKVYR